MIHDLKTWPIPFESVWTDRKRFEIRVNDRDFKVGDVLRLREWSDGKNAMNLFAASGYSGREVLAEVDYIAEGAWGLPAGLCVMSIRTIQRKPTP